MGRGRREQPWFLWRRSLLLFLEEIPVFLQSPNRGRSLPRVGASLTLFSRLFTPNRDVWSLRELPGDGGRCPSPWQGWDEKILKSLPAQTTLGFSGHVQAGKIFLASSSSLGGRWFWNAGPRDIEGSSETSFWLIGN